MKLSQKISQAAFDASDDFNVLFGIATTETDGNGPAKEVVVTNKTATPSTVQPIHMARSSEGNVTARLGRKGRMNG